MQGVTYVAGATGFLGSTLSYHLASQGRDLLVSGRNGTRLKKLTEAIALKNPNINVSSFICDLSKPDTWKEVSSSVTGRYIDNYINCAGVQGKLGLNSEISYEEMARVFNINLFSSIFFTNLFAKSLQPNEKLSIIHFSGGGAAGKRPFFMPYSLSKTSLLRFVENFAAENLNENLKINAIAPGVMPSRMQKEVIDNVSLRKTKEYSVADLSLSSNDFNFSKILNLCDFLISNTSQGVTGKLISAEWDNWSQWPNHLRELESSDLYTLRRITGRDRGYDWGDL